MQARDSGDDETDEALMLAWQAGDERAFDRIYHRHRGGVFRYLLRHCRDRAMAEELHQDVWLKLIAARASFDSNARFSTWLYSVARNHMIDQWRGSRGPRHVSLDDDGAIERVQKVHEDRALFLVAKCRALTRAAPGPRRVSMSSACSFSCHNASLHMPSSIRPTGPRASRRAR